MPTGMTEDDVFDPVPEFNRAMHSRSEGPKVVSTSVSVGCLLTQGATVWR